jgi:DNA-binding transcriptional ArsR family regulator
LDISYRVEKAFKSQDLRLFSSLKQLTSDASPEQIDVKFSYLYRCKYSHTKTFADCGDEFGRENSVLTRPFLAPDLAELFKLLAHADRLKVIAALKDGERDVMSIAATLGLPHTRVSQHLALFRAYRLVEERREGRHHLYRLSRPGIADWVMGAMDFIALRQHPDRPPPTMTAEAISNGDAQLHQ